MLEPERSVTSDVTEKTFRKWLKKKQITADRHDHPNVSYVELMDPSGKYSFIWFWQRQILSIRRPCRSHRALLHHSRFASDETYYR